MLCSRAARGPPPSLSTEPDREPGRRKVHRRRWPTMNLLIHASMRLGLLREDLDYHLMRAALVVLFLFFGYQKWFDYEAQVLVPYISNGPLLSWMYPVFGIRGA